MRFVLLFFVKKKTHILCESGPWTNFYLELFYLLYFSTTQVYSVVKKMKKKKTKVALYHKSYG